ncbi:MAG: HAMP domain-containing histidine kinase [Anaerolineae bacterium]|nr:HAMP domain-containing histidine kinase [Anaerolineae bacterium]
MFSRLNIRQRILLIFILITLAGGMMQFFIAGRQLQLATLEFYQHHLETDGLLVAATFAEPLGHYLEGEGEEGIGRTLAMIQQEVGHNYLIVDHNYRVVGYTADTGYEHIDRVDETPELVEARSERIGADIRPNQSGQDTLYLAVSVLYEGDSLGYLVLSEPMQPAYREVNQRYIELAGASLPVLGLVIAASLWISGTISRPVQSLRNSAMLMAKGALDTRIQITSQDEVGQLAETFNYMAGQIESLMKTQRSFVSNAAHELRTPLMMLKLRAEALAEETLPTAERDLYLREIRQEIDHMAELVSSLLMLARIDEGRYQQNRVVTDTVSTLYDILRNWRIEAEKRALKFDITMDTGLPELPMSPNDLRLILDNLLANAIKYTSEGSIHVKAAYSQKGFALEVQDTGVGFTPEQSVYLFERFYRSEQVRGKFAGNGLGLSVVKSILQQYGGQVEAQSKGIRQGATFTVTLPLSQLANPVTHLTKEP